MSARVLPGGPRRARLQRGLAGPGRRRPARSPGCGPGEPGQDRWHATIRPDAVGVWRFTVEAFQRPVPDLAGRGHQEDRRRAGAGRPGQRPGRGRAGCWTRPPTLVPGSRPRTGCGPRPPRCATTDAAAAPSGSPRRSTWPTCSGTHPVRGAGHHRRRAYRLWVDRPRALFSAWYEFFPRSEGAVPGHRRTHRPGPAPSPPPLDRLPGRRRDGLRRALPAADPPDRPGQPQGPQQRAGRRARTTSGSPWAIGAAEGGHDAIHPDLGTAEDFRDFIAAGRRAGPGGGDGPGAAVRAGPPVGDRAPGVVHHPGRRQHRVRGEPAEEVPGHLPAELRQRPGGHPGRDAAGGAALGRRGHPDLPGGQPAHQAVRLLALADLRRSRRSTRTCSSSPRRSPGRRSCTASARSASPSRTPTSPGAPRAAEMREYCEELVAAADHMRPNFWPNTPDILHESAAARRPADVQDPGGAGQPALPLLGHVRRLRALRARGPARRRGVPGQREVRAAPPGLGRRRGAGPLAGAVHRPAQRGSAGTTRPCTGCATCASTTSTTRRCSAGPSATRTPATRSGGLLVRLRARCSGATPRWTCRRSASTGTSGSPCTTS